MSASVSFSEFNGSTGTETTGVTQMNLKGVDDVGTTITSAPIAAGLNSFSKYQCAYVNASGIFAVSSPTYRVSSNSPATGVTVAGTVINNFSSSVAYVQPTKSATGDGAMSTSNVYAAFSALGTGGTGGVITSGNWNAASAAVLSQIGNYTGYASPLRLQLQTTTSAATGTTPSFSIIFGWQEIG